MNKDKRWIGVDLDGTLARYDGYVGGHHIGEPIMPMVERVKRWHSEGKRIKIFTARVHPALPSTSARAAISRWCMMHLGFNPPVTCVKDFLMDELWDDRAMRVELNTGDVLSINDKNINEIKAL